MIDYLELVSEENERALLELERRMDRALEGALRANGRQDSSYERSEGRSGPEESLEDRSEPEEDEPEEGSEGRNRLEEGSEGRSGFEERSESQSRPEQRDRTIEKAWRADTAGKTPGKTPGETPESRRSKENPVRADDETAERVEEQKPPPALEKQLEWTERAVAAAASGVWAAGTTPREETDRSGRGNGWKRPIALSYPSVRLRATWEEEEISDPAARSGVVRRRDESDGAREWAERMDRVFRHDSRRYDGGFYLY